MDPVFEFIGGVGDNLLLYDDHIVIKHKGALNLLAMGIHGDKTIYYSDLTSVQYKKAGGILSGHIQFSLMGGRESKGGVLAASSDENTITFTQDKNYEAERVVEFINNKIREIKTSKTTPMQTAPVASVADELLKYKQLLDMGVLSQEEFEAKKNELLNPAQSTSAPAASTSFSFEPQKSAPRSDGKCNLTVLYRMKMGGSSVGVYTINGDPTKYKIKNGEMKEHIVDNGKCTVTFIYNFKKRPFELDVKDSAELKVVCDALKMYEE